MKFLINSSGRGIAGTLDSSYYKGQGERQGIEREFVVIIEDDLLHRKRTSRPTGIIEKGWCSELHARPTDDHDKEF